MPLPLPDPRIVPAWLQSRVNDGTESNCGSTVFLKLSPVPGHVFEKIGSPGSSISPSEALVAVIVTLNAQSTAMLWFPNVPAYPMLLNSSMPTKVRVMAPPPATLPQAWGCRSRRKTSLRVLACLGAKGLSITGHVKLLRRPRKRVRGSQTRRDRERHARGLDAAPNVRVLHEHADADAARERGELRDVEERFHRRRYFCDPFG